jgi:hypothetical protein
LNLRPLDHQSDIGRITVSLKSSQGSLASGNCLKPSPVDSPISHLVTTVVTTSASCGIGQGTLAKFADELRTPFRLAPRIARPLHSVGRYPVFTGATSAVHSWRSLPRASMPSIDYAIASVGTGRCSHHPFFAYGRDPVAATVRTGCSTRPLRGPLPRHAPTGHPCVAGALRPSRGRRTDGKHPVSTAGGRRSSNCQQRYPVFGPYPYGLLFTTVVTTVKRVVA